VCVWEGTVVARASNRRKRNDSSGASGEEDPRQESSKMRALGITIYKVDGAALQWELSAPAVCLNF
jgi:hypothetical protein